MTDLSKLLSDSSVSAQQAAEKLAGPCLEAIKKNEDPSKIEGEFDGLWSSVLSAAEQTPHDKQGKLVETLHAIKSIPQSAETAKKVVVWGEEKRWDELPMFGGKAREQLDIAQEKSDEAFVNINGFFARATAAGVDDLSLFAIWTLREALEDPAADKISETSPKLLKASSVWFIYAADALAKASKDGKQFDGKVAKPGASLTEFKDEPGWRGFNNDRWKVWHDRLSTLKETDVPEEAKLLVVQALSVIRDVSALKPDIRLAQAVSEFEAALTAEQKLTFRASRTAALSTAPTMSDVMRLTAEMDLKATSKHGRIRCFGPRLTNMLQAIQQFAALGDIVVGGSQNLIACGVWSAARMTVHVMTGYLTHLEKLSVLFMTVGRNAPRYQAMAAIYPKSKNLQRYLCEYFIVVTNLCYQLVTWVQKPALNRISTSLRDPDMKSFQADLDTWSASIKEEADLLLSQRFQEEARENATFRSIISYRSEYIHHRQKMDRSIRFLDACSQHDYRTTWKQTRKRGTTRTLPSYCEYQKWKNTPYVSDSILFRGKLGAGKSVLLANIIDDLNLLQNAITLYFFARHDTPDSLSSRTILGCLARQLLESFVNDTRFDHIFAERVSQLDLDDIIVIFNTIPSHGRPVYVVVDGLDEGSTEEQENVLRCLSSIKSNGYKICISVRTPTESSVLEGQSYEFEESIPEENQDISDFVQVEVDQRVRNKRLVTLDPLLVRDIKQELLDGACGMFLWVALQLDSICSEVSDSAIREAIRDLPRDLTQTYERNLLKSSSSDSKGYHIRIFKLLVGAREPLTREQLREAASVKTGHTIWSPQQHISNIQAALRFCGCLVMVDEEDDTVRFIHHSARSFCLNSPRNAAKWTFTEREANLAVAETLVTYLSYNVFDTRISKNVVPKIDANGIPAKVALTSDDCFVEFAREAVLSSDAEAFTFFLIRFTTEDVQHFRNNAYLIEWAISSGNVAMLYLLVGKGLATDPIVNGRGITQALKLNVRDELKFRLVNVLFRTTFDVGTLGEDELYGAIALFRYRTSLQNVSHTVRKVLASSSRISSRKEDILLRMACILEHEEETLFRFLDTTDASTLGRGCLDIALRGPFKDRRKLIWTLLNFGAQATTEVVDRALELRHWNLALHFLTKIKPNFSYPYFYSATTSDSVATIDSFLNNAELKKDLHTDMPQQCQLPIVQTYGWAKWEFYFGPPFVGDGHWGALGAAQTRGLTDNIHSQLTTTQEPSNARFSSQFKNNRSEMTLAVETTVFMMGLQNPLRPQTPCLRLSTPSSFEVISALTRRWQSISDSLALLDTDENSVMVTHYENYYPMWDSISRNNDLGRWLLPDSFWDTPKIRQLVEQRRYLARRNDEDAHWGLQILSKCLALFSNLPPGLTLDALDEVGLSFPSKPYEWPQFSGRLLSDPTYMALRIQWLRTLGVMFNKGLLTKWNITEQLLVEMGSMVEVLPGMIDMYPGLAHRLDDHSTMPETLEAAFLGAEGRKVLASLVRRLGNWAINVCLWIETVDTGIFMWSMGENAPLSFTRAFQSFREVGVVDEDMEMIERSLDVARGKISELE
ncbi:heterokaryon incompatibility protein het-E-1 [Fusarium coicis]|nr:heterokaryon incompatibility protein het-E-1 [Fusarium coicis]